ncbi:hypothetical protein [Humibacter sp.]|uniref:hypothetical protein n=1 Tax=Humibacter sp. TaxID=1940291 RepID=UPI002B65D50B|nr:hypothetical protein [Humibacter sp.]HVX08798.1 hypothetical protein [Humibacter sp.]
MFRRRRHSDRVERLAAEHGLVLDPEGQRRFDENAARLNELERWYGGRVPVPAARAKALADEIVRAAHPDLTANKRGLWVRPLGEGWFSVLGLRTLRTSYTWEWGVSVPWVPTSTREPFGFVRTAASADFALRERSIDLARPDSAHDAYSNWILGSFGETAFIETATKMWHAAAAPAAAFWSESAAPEGILAIAGRQSAERSINAPRPGLVEVCALIALGSIDQARSALESNPGLIPAHYGLGFTPDRLVEEVSRRANRPPLT